MAKTWQIESGIEGNAMLIRAAGRDDLDVVLDLYRHLHRHDEPAPAGLAARTWAAVTADVSIPVRLTACSGNC